MPVTKVQVTAPSRLHFGMFSFGVPGTRQFGGVGAMVDAPAVRLTITSSPRLETDGPHQQRVLQAARTMAGLLADEAEPACRIEVSSAPRPHVGLGSGTQVSLAVAAGLEAWYGRQSSEPAQWATVLGRGERSAIGRHGFARGGLLVEAGKLRADEVSPLIARVELPQAWRFVLVCQRGQQGLWGEAEQSAFEKLPPVPTKTTTALCREVLLDMLPAAVQGEFERFSRSVFRFGHRAGMCFAPQQGGAYAGPRQAALVDWLHHHGITGVGQSSWGPTLFATCPNQQAAEQLGDLLAERPDTGELEVCIAAPDNHGVRIEVRQNADD